MPSVALKLSYYATRLLALVIIFLWPAILPTATAGNDSGLSRVLSLSVSGASLWAEVADTDETRRRGLSHRQHLPADAAMLLVFDHPRVACLWMRDVHFAVDAAFIDDQGIVIGMAQMRPQTTRLHCSPQLARYALEVNAGWFHAHHVNIGASVMGLPR